MSSPLRPHGPQHTRLPCPSLSPRACSNSCPLSQGSHPTMIVLCCPLLLLPSIFPRIRVFSNELVLHIRCPKHWSFSFSISPSNEYSGLIFFRIDWLDLFAVQGSLKSLLQYHSSKTSILWLSAFFMVQLSHLYVKNHSFDYTDQISLVLGDLNSFSLPLACHVALNMTESHMLLRPPSPPTLVPWESLILEQGPGICIFNVLWVILLWSQI